MALVGGAAKLISLSGFHMPRLLDRYLRAVMFRQQKSKVPTLPGRQDALHAPDPALALRQRQGMPVHVAEHCPYTAVALRAKPPMGVLLGGGALFAAWRLSRRAAV